MHSDISEYNADTSYNSSQIRLFTYRQIDDDNTNDIGHQDYNNNRMSPNRLHDNTFNHHNNNDSNTLIDYHTKFKD